MTLTFFSKKIKMGNDPVFPLHLSVKRLTMIISACFAIFASVTEAQTPDDEGVSTSTISELITVGPGETYSPRDATYTIYGPSNQGGKVGIWANGGTFTDLNEISYVRYPTLFQVGGSTPFLGNIPPLETLIAKAVASD